jgi:hypothetical protein
VKQKTTLPNKIYEENHFNLFPNYQYEWFWHSQYSFGLQQSAVNPITISWGVNPDDILFFKFGMVQ